MKAITLKQHDNPFGTKYRKQPGDVYEHPQPAADICFKYVREATDQDISAVAKPADAESGKDNSQAEKATDGKGEPKK